MTTLNNYQEDLFIDFFLGIKVKLERDDSGPLGLNEKLGLPVRKKGVE